jgi:protein tyrosine/serine phosphatase
MEAKMKRIFFLFAALLFLFFPAFAAIADDLSDVDTMTYHIGIVEEGKIYRSSQPDIEFLKAAVERWKIRTVISLKGLDDKAGRREREFCKNNGIRLIEIPMSASSPDAEKVERAYAELTDPQNYPVLLHCRAGSDRTGLLVGLYRIRHDGWSLKKARCEMWRYGHFAFWMPGVSEYLEQDHKKIRNRLP